MNKKLTTLIFW